MKVMSRNSHLIIVFVILFGLSDFVLCQKTVSFNQSPLIKALRDSLDAVQYEVPAMPSIHNWKVIGVNTEEEWEGLHDRVLSELKAGERNIEIQVTGKNLIMHVTPKSFSHLKYPDANIRIISTGSSFIAEGFTFEKREARKDGGFWSVPYSLYDVNDMIVDSNDEEILLREEVRQVKGDIEQVKGKGGTQWRFQIDLPNLDEKQCKDFYVLLTRDWTSARHKVVKVEKGWLYFLLDSEELHSNRNPNIDWTQYKVRPRYRLINSPVSKGVHVYENRLYVPMKYEIVHINKGGVLFFFGNCYLNSLEISGFNIKSCGNKTPIGIYHCIFRTGAFIHDNTFRNLYSLAISTAYNQNVVISNNIVLNTRQQALLGDGSGITIKGNHLKNIGWMLNTRAISGGGNMIHICDNVIEDFNYGAISSGSRNSNNDINFIIERNTIRLNKEFTDNYIQNTLADGGGIYIGPANTRGIIRNNVVENIKGIHSNRGIFLDDGAQNLAIYGNLVINTDNSYDIDLRRSSTFSKDIPNHNTHNSIFQNIMTGGYRFQEKDPSSSCIVGENILLGTGNYQKTVIEISDKVEDVRGEGNNILSLADKYHIAPFVLEFFKLNRATRHVKTIIYK